MDIPINDLGQWTEGQLFPSWELPLVRGSRIMDLTGVVISQLSLLLYNASFVNIGTGGGSFVINNVVPGVVTYAQATGYITVALAYVKIKVNFSSRTPDFSDFVRIKVVSA